jgi:hypothetical protein
MACARTVAGARDDALVALPDGTVASEERPYIDAVLAVVGAVVYQQCVQQTHHQRQAGRQAEHCQPLPRSPPQARVRAVAA